MYKTEKKLYTAQPLVKVAKKKLILKYKRKEKEKREKSAGYEGVFQNVTDIEEALCENVF